MKINVKMIYVNELVHIPVIRRDIVHIEQIVHKNWTVVARLGLCLYFVYEFSWIPTQQKCRPGKTP